MASSAKQGRKIAMVGASGNIGANTLKPLIEQGIHSITVISRSDSKATFPDGVKVVRGAYDDKEFLTKALAGHDILTIQLGFQAIDLQRPLIEAAAAAGVKTVFPIEWGSDPDPKSQIVQDMPVLSHKVQFRELATSLGMNVVVVANNPWFDWSLAQEGGLWGVDIPNRKATLYDGGSTKFVTTTIGTAGRATAALLSLPDAELFRDADSSGIKVARLMSFHLCQRDILAAAQKATGTTDKDWTIEEASADEAVKKAMSVMKEDYVAMIKGFYIMHMRKGWGGDYSAKVGNTMEKLGVPEKESIDEVVKRVVKELKA